MGPFHFTLREVCMARRKAAEQLQQPEAEAANASGPAQEPAANPATAGSPVQEQAEQRQPGEEPQDVPKRKYEPVRGWTSRFTGPLKYRKLTDDTLRVIAFKFNLDANEKLPEEVLALMRENKQHPDGTPTGLKFQDTR